MEFAQQPYIPGETIAAVATPPGEGGVAIIRISGNAAISIAEKVFSGPVRAYKTHTAHLGEIRNSKGEKVDEVLLLPMRGKRSYTGEDTVEIHCHGGSIVTRRVLETVIEAGARGALPGEFTFKAFMNGKMDLSQAEAIQDLIGAKNERALDAAEKQLEGRLSDKVKDFQEKLNLIAAILEAWVDFPEEGLEFASMEEVCQNISEVQKEIAHLIQTFHDGKILHTGLSLCLVGPPNAGKSSLMNTLLDKERAIVSPIPGTTRDVLEDEMRLAGLNFRILDTAGIRETEEVIEKEGIRRSKKAMQEADLVLAVLDVQAPPLQFLENIPKEKTVVVWNKADLPHTQLPEIDFPYQALVSALRKTGISQLTSQIEAIIWKNGPPSKEEVLVTNLRHKEALMEAAQHLNALQTGLEKGISPEFLTIEMRGALNSLGKVLGTNVSNDILNTIFSTFCIGK